MSNSFWLWNYSMTVAIAVSEILWYISLFRSISHLSTYHPRIFKLHPTGIQKWCRLRTLHCKWILQLTLLKEEEIILITSNSSRRMIHWYQCRWTTVPCNCVRILCNHSRTLTPTHSHVRNIENNSTNGDTQNLRRTKTRGSRDINYEKYNNIHLYLY